MFCLILQENVRAWKSKYPIVTLGYWKTKKLISVIEEKINVAHRPPASTLFTTFTLKKYLMSI